MFYLIGDYYIGGFKNGKRDGKGKFVYAKGQVKEGLWKDGKYIS